MNTNRLLLTFALMALLCTLLIACSPPNQEIKPTPTPVTPTNSSGSNQNNTWEEIKGWFRGVAYSAAGVPIIGPLITGILSKVKPEDEWIVGAGLIFIILGALGGGSGASKR